MLVHFPNTDITSLCIEKSGSCDIRLQSWPHGIWFAYYLQTLFGNETGCQDQDSPETGGKL